MDDPTTSNQQPQRDNSDYWASRHYNIQRIVAIGGLAGLCVLIVQTWELHRTTQANRDSANAAKIAADAATAAIEQAQDASSLDQRPWAAPVDIIAKPPTANERFTITIRITNTGKTIARDFKSVASFHVKALGEDDPKFSEILDGENDVSRSTGILPPNGFADTLIRTHGDQRLTEESVAQIRNPLLVALLFGRITYKDVAGHPHQTTYCYRWRSEDFYEPYGSFADAN